MLIIAELTKLGLYPPSRPLPASSTWAARPAGTVFGQKLFITDVVPDGFEAYWNGANWLPVGGTLRLGAGGLPTGTAPTGSIGDNGALTLGTALASTVPNCYLYFPSGAIVSGSAAGHYYVVMSSTTVGVIYNNLYTSGDPTVPASPTPFVTSGPGAYTGVLTEITQRIYTIPAGIARVNSAVRNTFRGGWNNSAGAKTQRVKLGSTATYALAGSTTVSNAITQIMQNRGVLNRQIEITDDNAGGVPWRTASTGALSITAVNTANAFTVSFTGQLATATDYIFCEAFQCELLV